MKEKEIIKRAIEILKSVKKPTSYDVMVTWECNNGYDADFDLKMRAYFKEIRPVADEELRIALADIWNATIEYLWAGVSAEEEEPEQEMDPVAKMVASLTKEDLDNVKNFHLVNTDKGQRVLVEYKDGSRRLRKLHQPTKKEVVLNFDACEKELQDLYELGTHDYRSALKKLVEKYAH